MPKVGLLRFTTPDPYAQTLLDEANDAFLDLKVDLIGDTEASRDDILAALYRAWDYIIETTDQEIYK